MIEPLYAGVDSGKKGAVCALFQHRGIALCEDTPIITADKGTDQYDRAGMRHLLKRLLTISAGTDEPWMNGRVHVLIEEPVIKPLAKAPHKCSRCSNTDWLMKFDKPTVIAAQWSGFVLWEGIICGLQEFCPGLTYTHVRPSAWHNELFGKVKGGTPKTLAYNHVTSQWPAGPWLGPKGGEKDGRWDAACLADVLIRRIGGAHGNQSQTGDLPL